MSVLNAFWCRLAVVATLALAMPAGARPFTVDDLLATEEFAQVLVDPGGRWLVIERRDAAGQSPRFDLETHAGFALGQLLIADLELPGAARPLVPRESGTGYVAYGFSSTGQRLAIARLRGRQWELGVVTLATGTVQWFNFAPILVGAGRAVQWLSDDTLMVLAESPGGLPQYLRAGWQAMHELPMLWEQAATGGGPTATAVGSGHYRNVTAIAAPTRLLRIDLAAHRSDLVATGAFTDFEVAPDGRHFALLEAAERLQPAATNPVGVGTGERRGRLHLGDLDERASTPVLPDLDVADTLLRWSPDSRRLLVLGRRAATGWSDAAVFAVDRIGPECVALTAPGRKAMIAGPPNYPPSATAGWLGNSPVVRTIVADFAQAASPPQWYRFAHGTATMLGSATLAEASAGFDDRGAMWLQRERRLWRVGHDGRAEAAEAIPHGADRLPHLQSEAGTRGRDRRTGSQSDWWRSAAGWVTAGTGRHIMVKARVGVGLAVRAVALTPRALVVATRAPGGTGQIVVCTAAPACVAVSTINADFSAIDPARPVPIPGGDGTTSWLFLPPSDAGRPWPVVVIPYPDDVFGPQPPEGRAAGLPLDSISVQVLAAHGYAVLLPSLPRPRLAGRSADGLAAQVLAVVDRAASRSDIDSRRLALWGHSFGGYAAAVIATQTNRFSAVIASAGIYDLVSAYGTFLPAARLRPDDGMSINTMTGWVETGQPFVGAAPWQAPGRFAAVSPVFAAGQIRTPMLLMQGDRDIASLSQAEEMFSALYRQNKDAVLVSYWGEGHVVSSPANLRDLYARAFDWLDRGFAATPSTGPAASGGRGVQRVLRRHSNCGPPTIGR